MANSQLVVFSQVDAILKPPACGHVLHAVSGMARAQIPLVVCSGHTRAEIERVSQSLELRHPFICEHGNGLFIPRGYFPFPIGNARHVAGYDVIEFGGRYAHVTAALRDASARLGIEVRGFGDMPVEEVAVECGLSMLEARLAKLREYGELFRVLDGGPAAIERLAAGLAAVGLRCRPGPHYHHVGAKVHMSVAVGMLGVLYRRAFGDIRTRVISSADGDLTIRRGMDWVDILGLTTPALWATAIEAVVRQETLLTSTAASRQGLLH